jgi:hypothetical protein
LHRAGYGLVSSSWCKVERDEGRRPSSLCTAGERAFMGDLRSGCSQASLLLLLQSSRDRLWAVRSGLPGLCPPWAGGWCLPHALNQDFSSGRQEGHWIRSRYHAAPALSNWVALANELNLSSPLFGSDVSPEAAEGLEWAVSLAVPVQRSPMCGGCSHFCL